MEAGLAGHRGPPVIQSVPIIDAGFVTTPPHRVMDATVQDGRLRSLTVQGECAGVGYICT